MGIDWGQIGAYALIIGCALLVIGLLVVVLFGGIFVDQSEAIRALEAQGFSNVKITSHLWFAVYFLGCDKGDAAKFDAVATNPAGKQVEVYVCAGFPFKGATVRSK